MDNTECLAELHIGDDFGDNHATMKCQKEKGHKGLHQEKYKKSNGDQVTITWKKDEREKKS